MSLEMTVSVLNISDDTTDTRLGTVPAAFRALARQQIMRYPTVNMINATVTQISGNNTTGFRVLTSQGATFQSRKVILATGMQDVMPSTPGVAENWGKGIFWCPWCDGYQ
jgi:thioredoxin reductase